MLIDYAIEVLAKGLMEPHLGGAAG